MDKACKSNGFFKIGDAIISSQGREKLVANEVVIHRNFPKSRE